MTAALISKEELCPAGCADGKHDGHDCTTCAGTGRRSGAARIAAEAATQAPAGSVPPPRLSRQAYAPRQGDVTLPDSVALPGSQKEAI